MMFGIRPVKTLAILLILFLIFSATRINHKDNLDKNNSKSMGAYMEKLPLQEKIVTPNDAIKILHYLFEKKIKDTQMRCRAKKAKVRWFAQCQDGDLIKDNYWEIVIKRDKIKLLARSKASFFLIKKYQFRELESDSSKANIKVEQALKKFFIN